MAEHEPGSMDIRTQEQTFNGFVTMTKWAVVVIFAILIFLALTGI